MKFMPIKNEVSSRKEIARQHSRHKSTARAEGVVDPVNPNRYATEPQGITCHWLDGAMVIAFYRNVMRIQTRRLLLLLHCALVAAQCIVIGPVCGFVCVFVFVGLLPR